MKYLFVNPPIHMYEYAPNIGVPTLIGILEANHIESECINLNIEYLNKLLSKEGIENLINYYSYILSIDNYLLELFKINKNYIKNIIKILNKSKENIDFCAYSLKNKNLFLNYYIYTYTTKIILSMMNYSHIIQDKASSYFLPGIADYRSNTNNPIFNINIKELLFFLNSNLIPSKEFYNMEIEKIIKKEPEIVGISINYQDSFLPGLYIAYQLKQKTNIHINIGGDFFSRYYKIIENIYDFFNLFFDTVSIGNNTQTVLDLVKYIKNEISIDNVSNILYIGNKKELKRSNSQKIIPINKLPFESFTGYPFGKYFTPETCLPIVASTSCYWHQCNFCECYNKKYSTKTPQKIVEELEYLYKKYNTKYFYFWDNALHPNILLEVADLIIQKKLDIKYSIYARFEKEFNLKLLKKLKKSGCININFGLDTASEKLLKIINKGINLETVENILKNCYKIGIINLVYLILGHSEETSEDLKIDLQFIKKNKKFIDNLAVAPEVFFIEGSKIYSERNKYKSNIFTSLEERIKYAQEMLEITNSKMMYFVFSVFSILYITQKGAIRYRLEKKIFYLLTRKNHYIANLYIKWHKFLFRNRNHIKFK